MGQPMLVFKVSLAGSKSIWRRVVAPANKTLDTLHELIFLGFDREEEHLYSFYVPRGDARGRAALQDAVEYAHPFSAKEPGPFADERPRNAAKTKLADLGFCPGRRFFYLFDFGDEWWHEVTFERTTGPEEFGKHPRVVEKHGDSPPQYEDPDE